MLRAAGRARSRSSSSAACIRAEDDRVVDGAVSRRSSGTSRRRAAVAARARAAGRVVPLHVKVDTGMSRLGVAPGDAPALLRALADDRRRHGRRSAPHFATAESGRAARRPRASSRASSDLVGALGGGALAAALVHAANSAAMLSAPGRALRPGAAGARALRHPPVRRTLARPRAPPAGDALRTRIVARAPIAAGDGGRLRRHVRRRRGRA